MTFAPVLPPVVLAVAAATVLALRLLTMRRLAATSARWSTVWRWSGLTLALLLIMIAATNPGFERDTQESTATTPASDSNTNVFLVVDRSVESRGIREDVDALIDHHPNARFAVIGFSARPSLDWPLSADAWSLRPAVDGLTSYRADAETGEQVNAAAAATVLRYQLIAAGQQYPGSASLVYYLGAGAPGSTAPQGEFDLVSGSADGGAVLAHGARLDEQALRRIAAQLGVPYVNRADGRPLDRAALAADPPEATAARATEVAERIDLYWMFTLVAAVLLLFEIYLSLRDFRRTRMTPRDVAP